MDDLSTALVRNGVWKKCALRELKDYATIGQVLERPAVFVNGVAVIARLAAEIPFIAVFFECEPDAFYHLEPNGDTCLQLREVS